MLKNATRLLKPNGWLLIEDCGKHFGHEASKGPAMTTFEKMYMSMIHSKELDPIIGEHLEQYLRELDSFNDINARCVPLILTTDQQRAGICPAYFSCVFLLSIHFMFLQEKHHKSVRSLMH